ncbi:MAG: hypothetical protein ACK55Z_08680 [bacterium]
MGGYVSGSTLAVHSASGRFRQPPFQSVVAIEVDQSASASHHECRLPELYTINCRSIRLLHALRY